jgi:hypothetical protein
MPPLGTILEEILFRRASSWRRRIFAPAAASVFFGIRLRQSRASLNARNYIPRTRIASEGLALGARRMRRRGNAIAQYARAAGRNGKMYYRGACRQLS